MSNSLNQGLLEFIGAAPTPFHAVAELSQQLARAGYQRLDEREAWHCQAGSRYYVTRNDSSIIAFQLGNQPLAQSGLRLVGAHTDSPCLKLKPNPLLLRQGLAQLAVEVYGGALLAPWFDRDLSLAGRVSVIAEGRQHSLLLNFRQPIGVIPNLAIHLHRQANKGWEINPQNELPAIISQPGEDATISLAKLLAEQLQAEHGIAVESILDHELCLYDSQPPAQIGLQGEFIAAARLDNLLSCYAGLAALLAAGPDQNIALVCTDHEEIGSATACGADGPFLEQVVKRLVADEEAYVRCIQRSVLISADNAHAVHPNYADKHDGNHGPRLNGGPVIKVNSNQHYATNSDTASLFRQLCQQQQVPIQTFVTRSDMACGSTIGPITASRLGVATVDVGLPTLAMHSIRELAGAQDLAYLVQVLSAFYNSAQLL